MGRKPLDFKKKPIWVQIREDQYLILKQLKEREKKPISEIIREAIDLFFQQRVNQQVQIPNGAMAMGRNFNAGNITHVSNQTENSQNVNGEVLEFLDKLDYYNLLENLEWARKKLVKAYQSARAYYRELEQMTQMKTQLNIEPIKRHLSEKINECNKFFNTIGKFSKEFIEKRYPMPQETVTHIEQLYTLFLELKHEAKKKGWLVEEIVYKDWGKRRRKTPVGAM